MGNVKSVSSADHAVITTPAGDGPRVIEWWELPPRDERDGKDVRPRRDGLSRTLWIMFEKPIRRQPGRGDGPASEPHVTGTIRADFDRVLSGLSGIGLYLPGGARDQQPEVKLRTEVHVDFDVSLSALRYQHYRVVPDDRTDAGRGLLRSDSNEFYNVVPDHQTVIQLVNAISADDFYVKSVVENLPKVDNSKTNLVNRFWHITGHAYDGVFPIDFVINLRGDEVGDGGASAYMSKTIAEVTTKGTYANDEMLELIEGKWKQLHGKVTDVLNDRAARIGGYRAVTAQDEALVASPDIVVEAEVIDEPMDFPPPHGGLRTGQIATLYDRLDAADQALTSGRISAQKHDELVERIKKRLKDLGEAT